MTATIEAPVRKTGSDHVFETLYGQIIRLELLPGTKISEAETAKAFGCSRQPVREAFTRLEQLNLLLVRPQRATLVRPFSKQVISNAGFIRAAIESEVVRSLAYHRDTACDADLHENLQAQADAISESNTTAFHEADYQFHKLLCRASGNAFAFDLIANNKAQVDRLCMLSLTSQQTMQALYNDHAALLDAVFKGDEDASVRVLRTHLERLRPTIDALYASHRDYFED